MEGSDKRKLAVPMPLQNAKRCKSDGGDGNCSNTWCSSPSEFSITTHSSNFEHCVLPASFMFYERGEWKQFLQETSAALGLAIHARYSSVEFSLCGSRYLLSFVRMMQLNLVTGFCRSIAWIDANGKSFYPSKCIEGYGIHLLHLVKHPKPCARNINLLQPGIISSCAQSIKPGDAVAAGSPDLTCQQGVLDVKVSRRSITSDITSTSKPSALANSEVSDHDYGDEDVSLNSSSTSSTIVSSDSTSDVTSDLQNFGHTAAHSSRDFPLLQEDKLVRLKDTDPEFDEVKKKFMAGLSVLANHTTITGISKDCHWSTTGHLRHQAFKQHEKITKTMRGDANVRYAWYGTSKQGVSSIVLHGFGQPKTPKDGAMYGVGIYLAPENFSSISAVYSDVDENGEQHLVLCRVIMGNMEQVCRGSVQFHPGSEDFDGGVDDLCNPKQYIVWSTHMNTHILPEYIVSFKLATPWQGIIAALRGKRKVGRKHIQFDCQHTGPVKVRDDVCTETMPRCSYSPPRSPWMSIEMLFLLMKASLSVESMDALQQHYVDLKDGRLSSSDFINNVRLIAGDHLVSSSIRSMQTHVLGAVVLRSLLASGSYRMVDSSRIA